MAVSVISLLPLVLCCSLRWPASAVRTASRRNGRRLAVRACEYVKWIDPKWDGRAKAIICDLAMKNKLLQEEVEKKEAEKHSGALYLHHGLPAVPSSCVLLLQQS